MPKRIFVADYVCRQRSQHTPGIVFVLLLITQLRFQAFILLHTIHTGSDVHVCHQMHTDSVVSIYFWSSKNSARPLYHVQMNRRRVQRSPSLLAYPRPFALVGFCISFGRTAKDGCEFSERTKKQERCRLREYPTVMVDGAKVFAPSLYSMSGEWPKKTAIEFGPCVR